MNTLIRLLTLSLLLIGSWVEAQTSVPPIAHWDLNVCGLDGSTGEVLDLIGGNNGTSREGVSTNDEGRLCQSARFRGQGDNIIIPHASAFALAEGTLTFWFRAPDLLFSNNDADDGMALFSKDANGFGTGGHLTIWVTQSGTVRVRQQSASTSAVLESGAVINAGQWHHVTYTFDSSGINLYVDGAFQGNNATYTQGLSANTQSIIVGASAVSAVQSNPASANLVDPLSGEIDDIKLFNSVLSSSDINVLVNESAVGCASCTSNPTLLSHYRLDVCALNGSANEVVDVVGGLNGESLGGVVVTDNGKYCRAVVFDGTNDYLQIAHRNAMSLPQGAVSFWFYPNQSLPSSDRGLIAKDGIESSIRGEFSLYLQSDGRVRFDLGGASPSEGVQLVSNQQIRANEWSHVTLSWDGSQVVTHVNGQREHLVTSNFNLIANVQNWVVAASNQTGGVSDFFNGRIDDIRVFSSPLTTVDTQLLFNEVNTLCPSCSAERQALFYRFEEAAFGGAGSIEDQSGFGNDANPIGSVSSALPNNNVSCRVLDVPRDTSFASNAIDTGLDLNDFGNKGTLSFWYKSNQNWRGGGERQLFDAASIADPNRPRASDRYFFAVLRNSGRVRFAFEDETDFDFITRTGRLGFEANQWVHLAFTWDLDAEVVEIYANGTRMVRRRDTRLRSNQLANMDTLYIGDNRNRYLVSGATRNSANGQFDDVRYYNFVQSQTQIRADRDATRPCNEVQYYSVVHPSVGLTCEASQITISACADALCTLYDQPVFISVPTTEGTRQEVNFVGQVTLNVTRSSPGNANIDIQPLDTSSIPSGPTQCTSGCNIDFRQAAFVFVDRSNGLSTVLPDVIAESNLSNVGIRAVVDENGACQSPLEGEQPVSLSFDCISDGAPYSTNTCQVPFAGIPVQGGGSGVSSASLNLDFDNGVASLPGTYNDAGRLRISASGTIPARGEFPAFPIDSGSGAVLDIVPARLDIQYSASATEVAGVPFSLDIRSFGVDDSTPLPSFNPAQLTYQLRRRAPTASLSAGLEAILSLDSDATLTSALSAPFQNFSALPFIDGVYQTNNAFMNDVGEYSLTLQDSNYLGSTLSSNTVEFGRFIPAYFDVEPNSPRLEASCGDTFTYLGQAQAFEPGTEPFYRVTARNANGEVTRLYSDTLWRLNPSTTETVSAISVNDESAFGMPITVETEFLSLSFDNLGTNDGVGDITLNGINTRYEKPVAPPVDLTPFAGSLSFTLNEAFFTDADGVCYRTDYVSASEPGSCSALTMNNIGNAEQRFGRINLLNTYGPEDRPLRLPLVTEFFDRGNWFVNTQDNCTAINFSQVADEITVANASQGNETNISDQYTAITSTGIIDGGRSRLTDLVFTSPLGGHRGSVRVALNPDAAAVIWPDYLNIDWNNDGIVDVNDLPSALVSFGLYRGNDRIFHSREVTGED